MDDMASLRMDSKPPATWVLLCKAPAGAAPPRAAAAPPAGSAAAPGSFDEVYRGRRIKGGPTHGGGHHGGQHGGHHSGGYTVTIDGEELHVMQNADGTWISVITHYEPVATPKAAARAAVRELQGAPLVPLTLA
ncbi:tyrosinase cofactor [Streptomyces sp. NPDC006339]|uniref:apotyrosinase chaperone MelC1 n=1 Tax=Streptomyces sp. NPDC006339 TaxID=3156755 RepID=UPI0033B8F312